MKLLTATVEPVRGIGASDPPGPIKTSRDTFFFPSYESPVVTTPPHLLPRLPGGWMPGTLTLPLSLFPIPCQHLCRRTVQLRDGLACSRSNRTSFLWSPGPSYTASSFLGGGEDVATPSGPKWQVYHGREVLLCSKDCLRHEHDSLKSSSFPRQKSSSQRGPQSVSPQEDISPLP